MSGLGDIGLGLAFLAGVISFLSPCVLPLVPGYLSFVGGASLERLRDGGGWNARAALFLTSLPFVAGFSIVFITLGASASGVGRLLLAYRYEANIVAGALIVLFGLHMSGLLPIGVLLRQWTPIPAAPKTGPTGSFALGLSFAFGWTPCIGPVLGAILAAGAATASVADGVALLAAYAAGLAVPFITVALLADRLLTRLRGAGRWSRQLRAAAGGIMIAAGLLMATGALNRFGTWLLKTFPTFATLTL